MTIPCHMLGNCSGESFWQGEAWSFKRQAHDETQERESMKRRIYIKNRRKNRDRAVRRKIKIRRQRMPTTARQYFSRSRQFQDAWDSVGQVISKMRVGRISLRRASKEIGVDPSKVIELGRSALRKQKNGKYAARKEDQLLRILSILTPEGRREIAVRGSHQASILGRYWAGVQRYLQTGDDVALRKFQGKKITDASGKRHPLITNLNLLNSLGSAGVLSFESLYAGVR
jgi:hypothetical protein